MNSRGMMDRIRGFLSLTMTVCIILGMLPFAAGMESVEAAETLTWGDYNYQILEDGTAAITKYLGSAAELQIAGIIDGRAVTAISDEAFWSCGTLTGILVPEGVVRIGGDAFNNCSSLKRVQLSSTLAFIGVGAFSNCSSLESIQIPDKVEVIGAGAFSACSSLKEIVVSEQNANYCSKDGILFNKSRTQLISYPGAKSSEYTVPDGVVTIGYAAFHSCANLTGVNLPDSVAAIESYAFYGNRRLTSVTIPASVVSIGSYAFGYISADTTISGFTVIGTASSAAQAYARANGLAFIPLHAATINDQRIDTSQGAAISATVQGGTTETHTLIVKESEASVVRMLMASADASVFWGCDLSLVDGNGNAVTDFTSVSITLPLPQTMDAAAGSVRVYTVARDGTLEALDSEECTVVSIPSVRFSTSHFSEFLLAYTPDEAPESYTITYDLAGGTDSGNPKSYTALTETFTLAAPVRDGYTFAGWTGSNGTVPQKTVTIAKGSSGNRSYKANWEPASSSDTENYTITYFLNGGTVSGNRTSYTYGMADFTLINPTRQGYTFLGWTGSNGYTPQLTVTVKKGMSGNLVYNANWSWSNDTVVSGYTITYKLNGGSAAGNPTTYTEDTDSFALRNPTRKGYSFTGWTGSLGAKNAASVVIPKGTKGNLTFTAGWTPVRYSISYNLKGGDLDSIVSYYTIETATFTLSKPTRQGYVFTGWTGSNGSTAKKTVKVNKGTTGNLRFTANWKEDEDEEDYDNSITGTSSYSKRIGDKAFVLDAQAHTALTYKSNDKTVCTVSSSGKVTIKGIGTAKIKVVAKAAGAYAKATKQITIKVRRLAGTSILSADRTTAKRAYVSWKINKNVDGYEFQFSRSADFSKNTMKKNIKSIYTTGANITNLRSERKYYARIRTYKTVNGKKYYSAWSEVRKIKKY